MKDRDVGTDIEDRPTLGQDARRKLSAEDQYRAEVQRYPKLTDEENATLARRIQAAEARNAPLHAQNREIRKQNKRIAEANQVLAMFAKHKDRPFLRGLPDSPREPHPLIPEVDPYQHTDHEAIDAMVRGNLDYAMAAARIHTRGWWKGLDYMEMVGAANSGLLDAVQKYNPDKEPRPFAAYAWWKMRDAMLSHSRQQRSIVDVPADVARRQRWVERARRQLEQSLLRRPSAVELAAAAGVDVVRLHAVQSGKTDLLDLDRPVGEGKTGSVVDLFFAVPHEEPLVDTGWDERLTVTRSILTTLTPQQAKIVAMYYGIDPDSSPRGMSFWEICLDLDMPEARVERLFETAMARLHAEQADDLRPVFEEWMEAVA
jgi:RNA polymerase sigma factor (sigma-70 family)